MKVKTLVLGLIFLALIACEKGIENPYSPSIKDSTQVEFRIEMITDVRSVIEPPGISWWSITVEIYINNECIGEIEEPGALVTSTVVKTFVPSKSYQLNTWYWIKFKFKDTNIPIEWQEAIGFSFCAKLKTVDSDFEIDGGSSSSGWRSFYTGYFWGWKVGDWKEFGTSNLGKFRILRK